MKEKNLPIKIFKKRDNIDDRRTEGMSNDELPKWVLTREELLVKVDEFQSSLNTLEKILQTRVKNDNYLPAVLKVSLRNVAIAKSHRTQVGKLFNVNHKYNFIGMSDDCDLMVKVDNVRDLKEISKNVSSIDKNAYGLSAIEDLDIFSPAIEEKQGVLKVKLINYNDYSLNSVAESIFINKLSKAKIQFKKTRYAEDLTIFKLEKVTTDQFSNIEDFEAFYSIVSMPQVEVGLDFALEDYNIPIKVPTENIDYPIIGVLDSGIADIPHLKPWLLDESYSSYPEGFLDKSHGTFVAGVIVYGDELEGQKWTGFEGCKLFSAAVFPDLLMETVDEDQLIENIREAINSRKDIKIWNLSLGLKSECDLNDFSDFGKFLDDIQLTNDILICKSAGNCKNFSIPAAVQRIPKSADSVRSLVVGSIAHKKGLDDIAEINWPSPFSRVGYGPNTLIKPDIIHYGGNAGKNKSGKLSVSGVRSFSIGGATVSDVGTSFSTPRITTLASGLNFKIEDNFNPLLLKALIIHSAKYPENVTLGLEEKVKYMGYGLPADVDEIIYNSPNEITLILQDSVIKGSYYEILDFPFPTNMIEDGKFYGEITLTLVSSPIVDNNNATEYCQSNIDVSFGTYDKVKVRDIEKRYILNEYGTDGAMNLLNPALYSKKHLKNPLSPFAGERLLRNYGKKYHPVKKYSINLHELTETNSLNALTAPKKWYLRLEGLYGSFIESRAAIDGTILSQEFCMIVTIKDKRNATQVYDNVTRLLDTNNFLHQNIKLRNTLDIRYGAGREFNE
ncbi:MULTISPECIES: S8 family peptidase [Sphingobacterium]|uniref:S8 family peptidase n=1 Tax=Sphingobacterium TaxID=28453 RepID=UPI00257EE9B7|nr:MULTISPECIES: S8 family peptidase [Sphingobacterium]